MTGAAIALAFFTLATSSVIIILGVVGLVGFIIDEGITQRRARRERDAILRRRLQ